MMTGTIRFKEDKGFYVEHSPKIIYSNSGGEQVSRTFYQELMLNPFTDNTIYKEGDEINFNKELHIETGIAFYYAEVVQF